MLEFPPTETEFHLANFGRMLDLDVLSCKDEDLVFWFTTSYNNEVLKVENLHVKLAITFVEKIEDDNSDYEDNFELVDLSQVFK